MKVRRPHIHQPREPRANAWDWVGYAIAGLALLVAAFAIAQPA